MKSATWIGLAIIVGALAFGGRVFVKGLTPYVTFDEARRANATVQVMGKLDKGSIHYSASKSLDFVLVSDHGDRLPVTFVASRPANFEEAVQVIAIGTYDGKVFEADNLLVKCPSKYQGAAPDRNYARQSPVSPPANPAAPRVPVAALPAGV
ncbi:MAG: cytochrome c maturation protein CcmE [Capsulimonadaceae bacterium]